MGRISAPQAHKEMLHPERRFQLCPGVGNVLNPDPAQSKSKGPALDSPGTQVADLLPQTPSRASRASRAVAMENVIGMVSAKWAEWDAYVEPLVFTYIEKVSFFRSRWWWQRCKRFLVCLYCQRKAAARSQRPAPQLQALTHHFSHPRASMLEHRFSGRIFGKNLRSTFGSNRTSSSPPRSR